MSQCPTADDNANARLKSRQAAKELQEQLDQKLIIPPHGEYHDSVSSPTCLIECLVTRRSKQLALERKGKLNSLSVKPLLNETVAWNCDKDGDISMAALEAEASNKRSYSDTDSESVEPLPKKPMSSKGHKGGKYFAFAHDDA